MFISVNKNYYGYEYKDPDSLYDYLENEVGQQKLGVIYIIPTIADVNEIDFVAELVFEILNAGHIIANIEVLAE